MPITLIRKSQLANLGIVDADVAANAAIATSKLADGANFIKRDGSVAMTGALAMGNQKITGLANPTAASDAATKGYVDGLAAGLDIKASVRAASTANITFSLPGYEATEGTSGRGKISGAPNTLDGVTLAAGNRILIKNQSSGAANGIYVVTTVGTGTNGVWDRATDFDEDTEVTAGAFVFVEEGTVNADSGWVLSTNNPVTIGGASGTALSFEQFSGAGQITAGNGLTKTGNTINAVGTADRITVGADAIDIASTYVGQASITTVGTISSGTWQGTQITDTYLAGISGSKVTGNISGNAGNVTGTVAVGNGGTGATSLTGVVIGNGTNAMSAVTGTANQVLRRNGANNAFEFATLDASSVGALSSSTSSTQNGYFGDIYLWDDSTPSHYLQITNSANLTAATTLSLNVTANATLAMAANLTVSAAATVSGTNTGDQTITLTGDVTGSGTGSFTATIANNAVTYAKFQQVAALSVVGNATNASANAAAISAGSDHQVLRRSGTSIGFGAINLASGNAVTGLLPVANIVTAASGVVAIANYIVRATPGGTVDGTNATFTLATTPVNNTEMVFVNGVLQNAGSGNDYTISGATITFLSGAIPQTGDIVRVTYIRNDAA
jgi:hypothetical protein